MTLFLSSNSLLYFRVESAIRASRKWSWACDARILHQHNFPFWVLSSQDFDHYNAMYRIQCGDCRIQEYQLHCMGCWWSGQGSAYLNLVIKWHTWFVELFKRWPQGNAHSVLRSFPIENSWKKACLQCVFSKSCGRQACTWRLLHCMLLSIGPCLQIRPLWRHYFQNTQVGHWSGSLLKLCHLCVLHPIASLWWRLEPNIADWSDSTGETHGGKVLCLLLAKTICKTQTPI